MLLFLLRAGFLSCTLILTLSHVQRSSAGAPEDGMDISDIYFDSDIQAPSYPAPRSPRYSKGSSLSSYEATQYRLRRKRQAAKKPAPKAGRKVEPPKTTTTPKPKPKPTPKPPKKQMTREECDIYQYQAPVPVNCAKFPTEAELMAKPPPPPPPAAPPPRPKSFASLITIIFQISSSGKKYIIDIVFKSKAETLKEVKGLGDNELAPLKDLSTGDVIYVKEGSEWYIKIFGGASFSYESWFKFFMLTKTTKEAQALGADYVDIELTKTSTDSGLQGGVVKETVLLLQFYWYGQTPTKTNEDTPLYTLVSISFKVNVSDPQLMIIDVYPDRGQGVVYHSKVSAYIKIIRETSMVAMTHITSTASTSMKVDIEVEAYEFVLENNLVGTTEEIKFACAFNPAACAVKLPPRPKTVGVLILIVFESDENARVHVVDIVIISKKLALEEAKAHKIKLSAEETKILEDVNNPTVTYVRFNTDHFEKLLYGDGFDITEFFLLYFGTSKGPAAAAKVMPDLKNIVIKITISELTIGMLMLVQMFWKGEPPADPGHSPVFTLIAILFPKDETKEPQMVIADVYNDKNPASVTSDCAMKIVKKDGAVAITDLTPVPNVMSKINISSYKFVNDPDLIGASETVTFKCAFQPNCGEPIPQGPNGPGGVGPGSVGGVATSGVGAIGGMGPGQNAPGGTGPKGQSAPNQAGGTGPNGNFGNNQPGGTGPKGQSGPSQPGGTGPNGNFGNNQPGGTAPKPGGMGPNQPGGTGPKPGGMNTPGGTAPSGNFGQNSPGGAGPPPGAPAPLEDPGYGAYLITITYVVEKERKLVTDVTFIEKRQVLEELAAKDAELNPADLEILNDPIKPAVMYVKLDSPEYKEIFGDKFNYPAWAKRFRLTIKTAVGMSNFWKVYELEMREKVGTTDKGGSVYLIRLYWFPEPGANKETPWYTLVSIYFPPLPPPANPNPAPAPSAGPVVVPLPQPQVAVIDVYLIEAPQLDYNFRIQIVTLKTLTVKVIEINVLLTVVVRFSMETYVFSYDPKLEKSKKDVTFKISFTEKRTYISGGKWWKQIEKTPGAPPPGQGSYIPPKAGTGMKVTQTQYATSVSSATYQQHQYQQYHQPQYQQTYPLYGYGYGQKLPSANTFTGGFGFHFGQTTNVIHVKGSVQVVTGGTSVVTVNQNGQVVSGGSGLANIAQKVVSSTSSVMTGYSSSYSTSYSYGTSYGYGTVYGYQPAQGGSYNVGYGNGNTYGGSYQVGFGGGQVVGVQAVVTGGTTVGNAVNKVVKSSPVLTAHYGVRVWGTASIKKTVKVGKGRGIDPGHMPPAAKVGRGIARQRKAHHTTGNETSIEPIAGRSAKGRTAQAHGKKGRGVAKGKSAKKDAKNPGARAVAKGTVPPKGKGVSKVTSAVGVKGKRVAKGTDGPKGKKVEAAPKGKGAHKIQTSSDGKAVHKDNVNPPKKV